MMARCSTKMLTVVAVFAASFCFANASLEEAYNKYLQGNYKGAQLDLNRVLQNDPNAKSMYSMKEALGIRALLEMSQNKHLKEQMDIINAYVWQYEQKQFENPRKISYYLRSYMEDDSLRHKSLSNLVGAGQFAVPQLLQHLGQSESNIEKRTLAYQALDRIGRAAVLPMLAATFSNDSILLTNIIRLLGKDADMRALPYLMRIKANVKDKLVQEELAIVLQKYPEEMQSYHYGMLFINEANRYLREGKEAYLDGVDASGLLWEWDSEEKKLTHVDLLHTEFEYRPSVPATLWPLFKAEAIHLEMTRMKNLPPELTSYARASLICIWATQELRAKSLLKGEDIERMPDFKEKLKSFLDRRMLQMVVGHWVGPEVLLQAVDISQKTFRAQTTSRILQMISQSKPNDILEWNIVSFIDGEEYNPLLFCQQHEEELVRYWTAIATANCQPSLQGADDAKIIDLLAQASDEIAVRTVLFVTEKTAESSKMVSSLEQVGYKVYQAHSGYDGLNAIYEFPSKDLILLNPELNLNISSLDFVNKLKEDYKGKSIPLAIYSSEKKRAANLTTYQDYAQQLIVHSDAGDILKAKMRDLEKHLDKIVFQNDLVTTISLEALKGLAMIDNDVLRKYPEVVTHLMEVVSGPYHTRDHQVNAVDSLKKYGELATEASAIMLDKFKQNIDNEYKVKILSALRQTAKDNLLVLDYLAEIIQDTSVEGSIRFEAASYLSQEQNTIKEPNKTSYNLPFFSRNQKASAKGNL